MDAEKRRDLRVTPFSATNSYLSLLSLLIAALLLSPIPFMNEAIIDKRNNRYFMLDKELERLDESYDLQVYGSCHAYTSYNPTEIVEEYGVSAYVMANPGETIPTTYLRMMERFKKDTPKVALLDIWGLNPYDTYDSTHSILAGYMPANLDLIPISAEKLEVINDYPKYLDIVNENFAIAKYKNRLLKYDMQAIDFNYSFAEMNETFNPKNTVYAYNEMALRFDNYGYKPYPSKNMSHYPNLQPAVGENEIHWVNPIILKYLEKIITLCEEKDVKLIIYRAPYISTENELRRANYLERFFYERNIAFYDLEKEIEWDYTTDFYDLWHLSETGAKKSTAYLNEIIHPLLQDTDAQTVSAAYIPQNVASVLEFSNWLNTQSIPFLYVQAPYRTPNTSNFNATDTLDMCSIYADNILTALQLENVNTLDLRSAVFTEADSSYFHKSDSQWSALGAFKGFQMTVEALQQFFPNEEILGQDMLNEDYWTVHTYYNSNQGIQEESIAQKYVGQDELIWMTPNFETQMRCMLPLARTIWTGRYESTVFNKTFFADTEESNKPVDLSEANHTSIYAGANNAFVVYQNDVASVDKKILIITDDFSLPYQAYLSTIFTEVQVINPRINNAPVIAEHIMETDPDAVMLAIDPIRYRFSHYYQYGLKSLPDYVAEDLVYSNDLTIEASDNPYNHITIENYYRADTVYKITMDSFTCSTDDVDTISIALYDSNNLKIWDAHFLDLDEEEGQYCFYFRTPETINFQTKLIIYPGIPGECENVEMQINNMQIYRIGE